MTTALTDKKLKLKPEAVLKASAAKLKKDWPGMSLRAVAARLEISPSYWSKILSGKAAFPQTLLARAVKVLAMDAQSTALLQRAILDAIELEQLTPATGLTVASSAESPVEDYGQLGRNEFFLLEDWFYIPVLNAFTAARFARDPAGIAKRLRLDPGQVATAIERLQAHGLLKADESGVLRRTEERLRFPTDRSHASIRRYHQAVLRRAHEELNGAQAEATFERRLIAGVCFTGSAAKLKQARLILDEAMYRVANLMSEEPGEDIFQLSLQLFPLSSAE
ncbi:MAG: TIGR02147 family protein [Proteobacteria bacterium]|nr:MAG: TIGR02147 family protein [Pseudomonadota bacterium]